MQESTSLRQVNPLQDPCWDELVLSHSDAAFFHTSAWAKVLHEAYNFSPSYLLATEKSSAGCQPAATHVRLLALLPIMDVRSPLTGCRGVSLPFTDACQPLVSEALPFSAFLKELIELGKVRRWKYWECRGVKALPKDVQPSLSFYGHTLDLSSGEKTLFDGFKSTLRTALRKAEQAGVQVEDSNSLEALQTFYSLHCKTRRKHGLPPQPFRFFRAIYRHILSCGLGRVIIGRIHQTPIAANIYFHSGTKAIYKYGASDDAFQELRGSNLVMWHAIQSYARQGYHSLDFGRTSTTAEGLRRFKLGFGAQEERIDYLRYDCRQSRFVPIEDEAFGWYNSFMGRMPLSLLRMLGAALYRHLG